MNVRVKFLGGAGSVTGSKYLLEIDDYRVLVDCGLFQGLKELRLRNWDTFPVDPSTIDAVLLTHAHIDHSGYLPKLVKEGFDGVVYCTTATADLLPIMLRDSAKLQEEESDFAKKKGYSRHQNPQPLYRIDDAEKVFSKIKPVPYKELLTVNNRLQVKYYNAGHILGAAIVELTVIGEYQSKKIVFSGDLGPYDNPLHHDPEGVEEADILFVESTYGNVSGQNEAIFDDIQAVVQRVADRGGSLIVPAFSVGRTQLMLYYFWKLRQLSKIPRWPVYVDSPMAISVTGLYRKHADLHRLKDETESEDHHIFDFPLIHYIKDQIASNDLNTTSNQSIIISASGMVTGGRILHHFYHRLRNRNDTILFTGFQAEGTRGRRILEGEKEIKIFGEMVPVRAHIESIDGFSAHADMHDLRKWLGEFKKSPKQTFIVHGEKESSEALANTITKDLGWNAVIPKYMESFHLFEGI